MTNMFRRRKGMTLIEVVVTIAIVLVVMAGFTLLFTRLWQVYGFTMETGIATFIASRGVDDAVEHIRKARQSENGSFPIISADASEFIFFSDYDEDNVVERVRYFAEDQQLKVGIIEPNLDVFPVTYIAAETITTLSNDVVNDVIVGATTCNEYRIASAIDGSSGARFTSIGMARNVSTAGEYFFILGGDEFQTQVTADGWVLLAHGDRDTNEDYYVESFDIDYSDDGILDRDIFNDLSGITEVRIEATFGNDRPFDVITTDAGVISRLQSFVTLGNTAAHSATWTGDGAWRMAQSGTSDFDYTNACTSDNLSEHLYFACDTVDGMIWSHGDGPTTNWNLLKEEVERENSDNNLNLYTRAPSEPTTFNITATRQVDDTFEDANSVSYTESELQALGGLCTDADVPVDRPVFSYYSDFADTFQLLDDSGSTEDFNYSDVEDSFLGSPVENVSEINLVKILLHVNPDPNQSPDNIKLQSFVNIRNLSTYDTTSQ